MAEHLLGRRDAGHGAHAEGRHTPTPFSPTSRTSHRRRGLNTGVPSRNERARLNTSEHTARLAGRAAQHSPRSGRGSRDLIYGTVHPRVLFITCAGLRLVSLPSTLVSALLGYCCSHVRSFLFFISLSVPRVVVMVLIRRIVVARTEFSVPSLSGVRTLQRAG